MRAYNTGEEGIRAVEQQLPDGKHCHQRVLFALMFAGIYLSGILNLGIDTGNAHLDILPVCREQRVHLGRKCQYLSTFRNIAVNFVPDGLDADFRSAYPSVQCVRL